MLAALRVIDPTDNDMTGARILANKPVAVSWGQDTDRAYYSDDALDTGFTVYPVNQLFLDPVLTIDKEVNTTVVPTGSTAAARTVTYTLTVKSYGFGPLSNVEVFDLLPAGVYGDTDYVLGTHPDHLSRPHPGHRRPVLRRLHRPASSAGVSPGTSTAPVCHRPRSPSAPTTP